MTTPRLVKALMCVLSIGPLAYSCTCASTYPGGCPDLGSKAGPNFVGRVVSVTDLPRTGDFKFLAGRRARLQVNENFGGLPPDASEVDVLTGMGGGDCGISFQPGEGYLVFAFVGDDGQLHTGICNSTRRIDDAMSTLKILRQRRDGGQVASLIGTIVRHDRNFEGLLGMLPPKPLGNTPIRLKSGENAYETLPDAEGFYSFYNLPAGKYEFAPDLPRGTELSWFIGSDKPLVPFELRANGCTEKDIEVFSSGSIQGQIVDSSGKPIKDAFAYIVPTSVQTIPKERQLYWECQCKESFFKFVHLPPGDYLIVVNPDNARKPEFPFPRTFYPGVSDRESAAVISIREGEHINNADIHLKEQFAPRHVTVRVTWEDGTLIKDFVFVKAKGVADPKALSDTRQADMKASIVQLTVLPSEAYEVDAELTCRYATETSIGPGAHLKTNKAFLAPADGQTNLRLTIAGTSCPEVPGKQLLTDREW